MKKWKLTAGIALVFVLGLLVGSLGTRFYQRDWSERFSRDPAARKALILKRLTKDLGLTEAQQREFKGIIDETEKKLEALGLERRSAVKAIFDESFSRMKQKLDPEQQKKLEELRARHEARAKDKNRRHHSP
jgi:Spy/CpxP family protein refolding chaperone